MTQFAAAVVLLIVGAVMGLFLRPQTVGWLGAGLFGLCVLGILVGAVFGLETFLFASGVAGMAAPFIGVLVFLGSVVGAKLRRLNQDDAKATSNSPKRGSHDS
jgi:hypothetical protein